MYEHERQDEPVTEYEPKDMMNQYLLFSNILKLTKLEHVFGKKMSWL